MNKQELGPLQRKWVEALRSGKYKQGRYSLHGGDWYCCLGVAHVVAGFECPDGEETLANEVRALMRFRTRNGQLSAGHYIGNSGYLDSANDSGFSFGTIADFVEAHPEAVFTEPA